MSIASLTRTFLTAKAIVTSMEVVVMILKPIVLIGLIILIRALYKYIKLKGR